MFGLDTTQPSKVFKDLCTDNGMETIPFGDLAFRKKCLLSELLGLDAREYLFGLSQEDKTRHIQIKGEIANLASLEEISWRQKSRILFVKEGDNKTRFFHRVANSYRRTNHIWGIEVDGVLYEDEEEVRSKVVNFYQRLYTESGTWCPSMDGLEFASIEEDERLELERDFPFLKYQCCESAFKIKIKTKVKYVKKNL